MPARSIYSARAQVQCDACQRHLSEAKINQPEANRKSAMACCIWGNPTIMTLSKSTKCRCKGACDSRRCACFKNREGCGSGCRCTACQNPLNGVDVSKLTVCAVQNIRRLKALTEDELNTLVEMPCGHSKVPLRELIDGYHCSGCNDELYWYSFCWNNVAQDSCSWHCEVCGQCRDWREWHCDDCNRCTYGVSLPCQNCERRNDRMIW